MRIKICGITRREDAEAAVAAGADALGFVFWPKSPRAIDPFDARAIVATLPPFVTTVGVFVNAGAAHVNAVARLVGLSAVQLHGDETPEVLSALRVPVIKAVSGEAADAGRWPARVLLLVDAVDPERRGGTGHRADWRRAAALAASRPVLLAGGLTPDNIEDAIAAVRPFGIDVSSGVEHAPGIKDHVRVAALCAAVTRATREDRGSNV